jgi:hypothetical protein
MSDEQLAALQKQIDELKAQRPEPTAPPPTIEAVEAPIPFTEDQLDAFKKTVISDPNAVPPTSLVDCMKRNGHGGLKGDRYYYGQAAYNHKTGEYEKGPRICEICGTVGI